MTCVFDMKKEELFWHEVWFNHIQDFVKIEFWNFDDVILLRKIDLTFVQIIRSLFKVIMKQNVFEKRFKYQKIFEKLYDETNS